MGRPPSLNPKQEAEVQRRLLAGDKPADLAREFKVSKATISRRFSKPTEKAKDVANQIVAAEEALNELDVSQQVLTLALVDELRAVSLNLAGAAKVSAVSAFRLAGMAARVRERVEKGEHGSTITGLKGESVEALKHVGALQKMSNDAAAQGHALIGANKDQVRRLTETPDPGAPNLAGLSAGELEQLENLMGKAQTPQ